MLKKYNTEQNRSGRIIIYAPLFLWIMFIFIMSGNTGAFSETSRFIGPLLEFLFPGAAPETIRMLHVFIRKSAHFFEYAVLAVLAGSALRGGQSNIRRTARMALILSLVLAVAAADEFGQSFRISRTASAGDVLIDFLGGLAATVTAELARRRRCSHHGVTENTE